MFVPVSTPACIGCGVSSTIEVRADQYDAWANGALVQVAFADEPADVREMLMTGTHPDCWDALFAE